MTTTLYMDRMARTPKPPPTPLGEWVRHVRVDIAQMTQQEFANALPPNKDGEDVARETVSNWELGKYDLEYSAMERIMKRFPGAPKPPIGDAHRPAVGGQPFTFAAIFRCVESAARQHGQPSPMDDNEFLRGLMLLWESYEKRRATHGVVKTP